MPEPNDEQQPQEDDFEREIEELIRGGTSGKPSLREISDAKAAEYHRRRDVESGYLSEEDDKEEKPERSSSE